MPPTESELQLSKESLRRIWVTSRLHAVSSSFLKRFSTEQFDLEVKYGQAWGAAGALQAKSPWREKPGPRGDKSGVEPSPAPPAALWDWVVVDEPALGLLRFLYRLPNNGLPRPQLLDVLAGLPGVRQLVEVSGDLEILVVAVVEDLKEAEDLRSRIQDHATGEPVRMDLISHENHQPARRTWIELARRQVERDREAAS